MALTMCHKIIFQRSKHAHKRTELPAGINVQINKNSLSYTILDAWGWCTGTTQRDGMGREKGGGFRMGNTCIPVVDSF